MRLRQQKPSATVNLETSRPSYEYWYYGIMAPKPRYRQIADDLRRRLAEGEFPVDSKLPPISRLQSKDEYDCPNNLNMIRHAQSVLIDEGLIEPRQGQGTFVIALPLSHVGQDDQAAALAQAATELRAALENAQNALTRFLTRLGQPGTEAHELITAFTGLAIGLSAARLLTLLSGTGNGH
jgi:DNA-binding GntR family transcriptional regulator